MAKGIIYLFSTSVKELCKIGRTDNLKERKRNIEANGYHNVSGLKLIYAVESEDMVGDENFIKELLKKLRIGDSELYQVNKDSAIMLLSKIGKAVFPESQIRVDEIKSEAQENISSEVLPSGVYSCNTRVDNKEYNAKLEIINGSLIMKKGSNINEKFDRLNDPYKKLRESMVVVDSILQDDFEVSSVSAAASLVAGHLKNGWDVWKDLNGDKIDKYRDK